MPTVRLTQRLLEAHQSISRGQVVLLWDATVAGFGVRLTPSRKTFVAQFRGIDRKVYRVQIGSSDHQTCDQAREVARQLIAAKQIPAQIQETQQLSVPSVAQLLTLFISEYVSKRHKATTRKEEERLITRMLLPELGHMPLKELSRAKIIAWHSRQLATTSANRALAHLSKACSFALQRGWIDHNPCIGIERNPEKARDRYFTDAELHRIGIAARNYRQEIYDCICLLALTGMRSGEVLNLTNDAFDPTRNVFQLIDSKTGARTIALSEQATTLCKHSNLNITRRIAISPASFSKLIIRVLEKAQVQGASAHTFRHTLATYMAQHGDSVFQIAAMGGWKSLSMVQRYVNLHGVGTVHPTPADRRIAEALQINLL